MIIKEITSRGRSTGGALDYVLGPSRDGVSVHLNPRIIGGWRPDLADRDLQQIVDFLDLPVMFAGIENGPHVWHVAISTQRATDTTPADRPLDDATFTEIARDVMTRCGMDRARWAAVRHDEPGKEHCHLIATTAAANGKQLWPSWPHYKMRNVANEWESRLELQSSARAGEGRSARSPTRGEMEKAKRNGWPQTSREDVRDRAIQAAQDAQSPDDFAARMTKQGTPVVIRRDEQGRATGFKVRALDGIWFAGRHLDRDLKKLMGRLEALSRTVDNTRELQAQATRAAAERRDAERSAQIRRAYTLPEREMGMAR